MILHDAALEDLCMRERLIEPYDPARLQPASIDLTLGSTFRVTRTHRHRFIDLMEGAPEDLTEPVTVEDEFVLHPGEFVLGATAEWIKVPDRMVGVLDGKSSLGRLGLLVHVTAGYFDPGFSGVGTLEFVNLLDVPIVLRPGLAICQFRVHLMQDAARVPYRGRYQGDMTVAPSRYGQ